MTEEDSTDMAEPNSVTTLKKLYGDRLFVPSHTDLSAELIEGNDRSTIITVASLADGAAESVIALNLPRLKEATEKHVNEAFRHDGPLGTFSARIDMLSYLGIIDDIIRGQLHTLRHMRNAAAHTKRRVTFSDKELQNVAKRLFKPVGMFQLLSDDAEGYRRTFIAEGNLIYNSLARGREDAIRLTRESYVTAGKPPPF